MTMELKGHLTTSKHWADYNYEGMNYHTFSTELIQMNLISFILI